MVGILLLAILVAWPLVAHWLCTSTLGVVHPVTPGALLGDAITSAAGRGLIAFGNAIGLVIVVVAMSLSVASFSILLNPHTGAAVTMLPSVRAVIHSPATREVSSRILAIALLLGSIPFLLVLVVVMPALGHATWHLYRCVVGGY